MRITSLELSGFRAFSGRAQFDLDADAVIVVGANGQGKTSLFDAIFWALAGSIPRLGPDASIISMYSPSGEARVGLELRHHDGTTANIVRSFDGSTPTLLLELNGDRFRGAEAEARLLRLLWPQALVAAKPQGALLSALERGVYLQQDQVRDFIEAETDQDRFTTVSELVGAGRVTELQVALERSRAAWSRVTNSRVADARKLRDRVSSLQAQHESLRLLESDVPVDLERWRLWWQDVKDLGVGIDQIPAPGSLEAATGLDIAVKQLQALRLRAERQRELTLDTLSKIEALPPAPSTDVTTLRSEFESAAEALSEAQLALAQGEERAAEIRRRQVEIREEREQLRVFAELALQHLGDRCPVCQQTYDAEAARERLEALAQETDVSIPFGEMPDIGELAKALREREKARADAKRRLEAAEQREREWRASREHVVHQLETLDLDPEPQTNLGERVAIFLRDREAYVHQLIEQQQGGERFALAIARAGQLARRAEVERELGTVRQVLNAAEEDIRARQRTGELVSELIEALRNATGDLVEAQLAQTEPLLQRIYATMDPHPAFRVVRLLTGMVRGRGRLVPTIGDPVYQIESDSPGSVLSSSQLNVLAVGIFIALNLAVPMLPLASAMLDDPLQSLDDLNLLGLIDLLRRLREERQLFISTHDSRFAGLLERKLRPVTGEQRTIVVQLEGWGRGGPEALTREVPGESTPLRLVG